MKTRAPAELCGEINLASSVCYSLVNRQLEAKLLLCANRGFVLYAQSKTNAGFCGSSPDSFVNPTLAARRAGAPDNGLSSCKPPLLEQN